MRATAACNEGSVRVEGVVIVALAEAVGEVNIVAEERTDVEEIVVMNVAAVCVK